MLREIQILTETNPHLGELPDISVARAKPEQLKSRLFVQRAAIQLWFQSAEGRKAPFRMPVIAGSRNREVTDIAYCACGGAIGDAVRVDPWPEIERMGVGARVPVARITLQT